ncbi:MAG: hypothetical protein K9J42_12065, partial [Sulfuritalea sp.]|nr:hypothetical protein [Sulfuritalea sp.]
MFNIACHDISPVGYLTNESNVPPMAYDTLTWIKRHGFGMDAKPASFRFREIAASVSAVSLGR